GLVDQGSRLLPRLVPAMATQNMPVNLVFDLLARRTPTAAPPVDEAAFAAALQVQRDVYAHEVPAAVLARNIDTLKAQARHLEAGGTRIVFFELPVHPTLEDTPRARQIRAAYAAAFPAHRHIGVSELSEGLAVRTIDGVHLALDEVPPVGRHLRLAAGAACAA